MSLGFTRFSGRLVLESDLHVGNGDADGNRAMLVHDSEGNPVIPGSTLKGALRACFNRETAERLFGTAKDDETGTMGRLILYAAVLRPGSSFLGDLPAGENGTALATHVAIDRVHGGAESQKLFQLEIVPAGACFDFDAVALGASEEAEDDIRAALVPLATGLALGRGIGKGNGRMRLEGASVRMTRRRLDVSGDKPKAVDDPPLVLAIPTEVPPVSSRRFDFRCPGPYLSHNPCEHASDGRGNILFSLRRNALTPVLWPESLYGVLRRRCAWIARTDDVADADDRFRVLADNADPRMLTRTERLFGVTGWRGLICLGDVALEGGERMSAKGDGIAGTSLDRFSGAVLDDRLFFGDAWTGLTLTFTLGLDLDRYRGEEDEALFDALVAEIQDEGLQLGHGTNRGFGWFDPLETQA